MGKKLPRIKISYYDQDRPEDVVVCAQWELVQAERKFGVGCMEQGNLDAITYAAFLSAQRSGIVGEGLAYDAWASTVALTDMDESGESPAPPAT